ncbi:MAG TPA: hypothetical protein VIQ74_06320 [Gemmatimonadaceae bacterium]|jgi:hypothetical protein
MATRDRESPATAPLGTEKVTNGAALAAFLAAGVGAFAMGFVVVLSEMGIFSPPAIYAPSGGVSGRTTLAVVLWLIAWAVLHARWKDRQLQPGRVWTVTLVLTVLGILGTFPPFWALVS